jgi:hypothetical protein
LISQRATAADWLGFVRDLAAARWAVDLQRFGRESVILFGSDWIRENSHVA